MLRWRLILGILIAAALAGLCWLDYQSRVACIWLLPAALAVVALGTEEMLDIAGAAQLHPAPVPVYAGNLLLLAANWFPLMLPQALADRAIPPGIWPLAALAGAVLLVFVAEMRRYEKPGGATGNVAAAVLILVYVGWMLSFAVQLRIRWGMGALVSMLLVVKMGDIGAYTVGRLIGRRKMAPRISPGKTIEGGVGAIVFSCGIAWLAGAWITGARVPWSLPAASQTGWLVYGLLVGGAGMVGDLAESLLKRDVGRKDSSSWLPGFGGVLDMVDSVLLAAPVAWACWLLGLVGR
jgi:phosphatidate cytidylyltransferase